MIIGLFHSIKGVDLGQMQWASLRFYRKQDSMTTSKRMW